MSTWSTLSSDTPIILGHFLEQVADFVLFLLMAQNIRQFFIEKIINFTAACRAEFFDKSEHHLFVMRFVKCPIPDVVNLSMSCFGNAAGHKKIRTAAFDKFKPF